MGRPARPLAPLKIAQIRSIRYGGRRTVSISGMASDKEIQLSFRDYLQDPSLDPEAMVSPIDFVRLLRTHFTEIVNEREVDDLLRLAQSFVALMGRQIYQRAS